MTRADLKHCGKMPDAREELSRSVREGRVESRRSIKSLEGMGSCSHGIEAELNMHSFTVNCDTFSIEGKVSAVVPVTSVDVTCSDAMLALSFSTLLVMCLMKILVFIFIPTVFVCLNRCWLIDSSYEPDNNNE